jgi:hypothetical protein
MIRAIPCGRGGRIGFLLCVWLSLPMLSQAKTKKGIDTDLSNIIRPTLVNASAGPTLRFPVMSMPGSVFSITYGWLDISSNSVRYTVVQPTRKSEHDFDSPRLAINDLRYEHSVLAFKAGKKGEALVYLAQDRWGSVHSGPGMGAAANRESLGTISIYKTLLNFDGVMALVRPPTPPPPQVLVRTVPAPMPPKRVAAPPPPPTIVVSSPEGVTGSQTLEWNQSTMVIRGVAMDNTGIPVVQVNGSPANMRPQNAQAAEFWSDPLQLQAGSNRIQIVAANTAQEKTELDLTIQYQPRSVAVNPKALSREEIVSLLQGGVPPTRVLELVKERGIRFSPSADDLSAIREAGGTDDLMDAVKQAAPHS